MWGRIWIAATLSMAPVALAQLPPAAPMDQTALDACGALPVAEQQACAERVLAPAPEQLTAARERAIVSAGYFRRTAERIAGSGAARDLAFAAALRRIAALQLAHAGQQDVIDSVPVDAQADAWWQAAERAGDDVLALTLLLQAAKSGDAAGRNRASARWRMLEPDNLAALTAADAPAESLLSAAQGTTRYDSQAYPRLRWMIERLAVLPPTALEAAAIGPEASAGEGVDPQHLATLTATGIWLAEWLPAFQPLTQSCRDAALTATPTRHDQCAHVARVLAEHADITLAQSIGVGMLARLARTGAERADAQRRRRQLDWVLYQRGELESRVVGEAVERFMHALRDPAIRNEIELAERQLRDAGVPLDPPAGWQSPWRREG